MTTNFQNFDPIAPRKTGDPIADVSMTDPGLSKNMYQFGELTQYVEFAKIMCQSGELIPEHARNKPGVCLGLTMRAVNWGLDPFALAQESYQAKPGAPIAFQAKVFSAALRNNGVHLKYRYEGEIKIVDKPVLSGRGNKIADRTATGTRKCIAYIVENGEALEYETMTLDQITIKNSPLWHNDPDQQLSYAAARGWARRYRADLIMGAHSVDELAEATPMRDVTPQSGVQAMIAKARGQEVTPEPDTSPETPDTPADDAPHWTEMLPVDDAFPGSAAWDDGVKAYADGIARTDCPFENDPESAANWLAAWDGANMAADNE